MGELTNNINWLATIIGAIVAFLLGWLWYSPKLFVEKWAEGVRINFDGSGPSELVMVVQMVATFLLSWVIGITAASNSLFTAILITLTIVCLMAASGLFCQKSRYAIATETGFIVVMVAVMIVCQGLF